MSDDNITCDICGKIKWAFVEIFTTKRELMCVRFNCCVDCFKSKDINEIISKKMKARAKEDIDYHQEKIDEIKVRLIK